MELTNRAVITYMLKLVRPLAIPMCIAILLGVLGFICAIGIPVVSTMALLQVTGIFSHFSLSSVLLVLLTMAILRGVLHYGEQACNHYIAFKILAMIRDHVYTALRRLAPAKLDGKDKGNLISLITNDIELLEVFYAHTISPVMIAIITCFILLRFFAHLHIFALFIACAAYLTMAVMIPFCVHYKGKEIGQRNRDEIGNMSSFILESFRGISTILQYNMGSLRTKQMLEKNEEIEDLQAQMKSIEAFQMITSQIFISISTIVMFITMFAFYKNGEMSIYRVIMATILMGSSFGPVMALSSLANNLLSTLSSARRVMSLLEEEELILEVHDAPQTSFDSIALKDIDFAYEDEMILKNVSTVFDKGQTVGIIGKSGSGKSTLLKLIMRFYDPCQGSIDIGQQNIKNVNTQDMRQMFAYVTQETVLFHDSIENNLKIAKLDAKHQEIEEACQKANIHQLIMSLPDGYQTTISELGSSLSSGERQRIGLARAFLCNAPCILLDEPTSQLDVLNEALLLQSLQKSHQTKILVSHRQSTIGIANKMMTINQGKMNS